MRYYLIIFLLYFLYNISLIADVVISESPRCWPSHYSPEIKYQIQLFLDKHYTYYSKLINKRKKEITVCFTSISYNKNPILGTSYHHQFNINIFKSDIDLDLSLIPFITEEKSKITPYHFQPQFTQYQMAQKTIIHELAHIVDDIYHYSSHPNYYSLYKSDYYGRRGIGAYEKKDRKEHFAENLEYFFLDTSYQQRRPIHHAFYSQHLQEQSKIASLHHYNIKLENIFPSLKDGSIQDSSQFVDLKKKRLYAIDFVWAGVGKDLTARFGHAFFRLVYCRGEKREYGEECYKDINDHLAVGYVLFPNSIKEAKQKILGKNNGMITITPFQEVYKDYTKLQLRDIYTFRLKLTDDEKERFLQWIVYMHWSGGFSYQIWKQNCASLAKEHLRLCNISNLPNHLTGLETPQCFIKDLLKNEYIEPFSSLIAKSKSDHEKLLFINKGQYYPSYHSKLITIFQKVKNSCPKIREKSYHDFYAKGIVYRNGQLIDCLQSYSSIDFSHLKKTPFSDSDFIELIKNQKSNSFHRQFYLDPKNKEFIPNKEIRATLNFFYYLEDYYLDITEKKFVTQLANLQFERAKNDTQFEKLIEKFYSLRTTQYSINHTSNSYGIPLQEELLINQEKITIDESIHRFIQNDFLHQLFREYKEFVFSAYYKNSYLSMFGHKVSIQKYNNGAI